MTRAAAQREKMGRIETDNSTMLEMFWFLQSQSMEDARDLLAFIRTQQQGDLAAVSQWLSSKRLESNQAGPDGQSPNLVLSGPSTGGPSEYDLQDSESEGSVQRQPQHGSSVASSSLHPQHGEQKNYWRQHATVDSVQRAVRMFFESTGILFHVYEEEHIEEMLEEAFGSVPNPESTLFLDLFRKHPRMRITYAELAGMASVGILYLRASDGSESPPPELAQHFYDITRWTLDTAVEKNPLRAMKVCVLLTMYNIVMKATVALVYIGTSR
jgi:hypothetical protein